MRGRRRWWNRHDRRGIGGRELLAGSIEVREQITEIEDAIPVAESIELGALRGFEREHAGQREREIVW